MKRRPILIALVVIVGAGIIAIYPLKARNSAPTPPPPETELRAFVRLAPAAFRPLIAKYERSTPAIPMPRPFAVGVGNGVATRILKPSALQGGHYNCRLGQLRADGTYIPPRVPFGSAVEIASYTSSTGVRELRLILAGAKGTARYSDGFAYDAIFADGNSTAQDLGPLPLENGRYPFSAPGSTSDGFGIAQENGAPPRRIALAPAELPPETNAEPQGYALLFDRFLVWQRRELARPFEVRLVNGPRLPFLPYFVAQRLYPERKVSLQEQGYRVSGLAHVYVRRKGHWRYARTWSLDGHGSTWMADDHGAVLRSGAVLLPTGVVSSGAMSCGKLNIFRTSRVALLMP